MNKSTCIKLLAILASLSFIGADDCAINQGVNQNTAVNNPQSVPIFGGYSECGNVVPGETWTELAFEVGPLTPGYKVMLAANGEGTGAIVVDDEIQIWCQAINQSDVLIGDTLVIFDQSFHNSCLNIVPHGPFDISYLFRSTRSVSCRVFFKDVCGGCKGSSLIWLAWVEK